MPSLSPSIFDFIKIKRFNFEYLYNNIKTIKLQKPKAISKNNFWIGICCKRKFLSVSNSIITATKIKDSKRNKSTIRSAIIVPKALSKGTSLYFFKINALETSPARGTDKLTK